MYKICNTRKICTPNTVLYIYGAFGWVVCLSVQGFWVHRRFFACVAARQITCACLRTASSAFANRHSTHTHTHTCAQLLCVFVFGCVCVFVFVEDCVEIACAKALRYILPPPSPQPYIAHEFATALRQNNGTWHRIRWAVPNAKKQRPQGLFPSIFWTTHQHHCRPDIVLRFWLRLGASKGIACVFLVADEIHCFGGNFACAHNGASTLYNLHHTHRP